MLQIRSMKNYKKMNTAEKQVLSFNEALELMDVSKSFLYKLTSERNINFFKPNNGKIYFRRSDLEGWMMQNEQKSLPSLVELSNRKIYENGK